MVFNYLLSTQDEQRKDVNDNIIRIRAQNEELIAAYQRDRYTIIDQIFQVRQQILQLGQHRGRATMAEAVWINDNINRNQETMSELEIAEQTLVNEIYKCKHVLSITKPII